MAGLVVVLGLVLDVGWVVRLRLLDCHLVCVCSFPLVVPAGASRAVLAGVDAPVGIVVR